MPIQVLRIGPTVVIGLPFEVTVESGRRVEAAVHSALAAGGGADGVERVAVSSLANEQFCYLTTPEEYSLQRYEGGNTLYGPQSQPFVAACAGVLAADVIAAGWVADHLPARHFDFAARHFLARPSGLAVVRGALADPSFTDATCTEDGFWQFNWRDAAPGDLRWHEPLVRVEAATSDGGWAPATRDGHPVDDQGYHLGVVHCGGDRAGSHRYAARWYTPYLGPDRPHRIVVLADRGRPELASSPFA